MINRNWKKALLALAVLSGFAVTSWYVISYFHKATVLARLLDPKLAVAGDVADAEEYSVYNAILSSAFVQASTELVAIENQTGIGPLNVTDVKNTKPEGFEISNETWNDFITKNSSSSKLGNAFTLSMPYVLFDPTDMVALNLELSGANIHYTPFLEFSRVGFNGQKDEAIVHVSLTTLGPDKQPIGFGQGFYFWLRKLHGVWRIEKNQETYIT